MTTDALVDTDHVGLLPWTVDTEDFPRAGTVRDAIQFCVRYALLAPSGHNTQPWWFRVEDDGVVVGLDPSRGLAVLDPDDREATISVGAAVLTLRVALNHFGFSADQTVWPDPCDPAACARLAVRRGASVDPELERLFDAITRRHTSRKAFSRRTPPPRLLAAVAQDAQAEGATLHLVRGRANRRTLVNLIGRADREQMQDKRFRRELSAWLRAARSRRPDGIRGYGSDLTELLSLAGPLLVRSFDVGAGRAARDSELATGSPVLAVLATPGDDRSDWLCAGQALARVLLRATSAGVSVGFLDQPIEVDELRADVACLLGADGVPQMLLRLGYGPDVPPQPRRELADVLEPS